MYCLGSKGSLGCSGLFCCSTGFSVELYFSTSGFGIVAPRLRHFSTSHLSIGSETLRSNLKTLISTLNS